MSWQEELRRLDSELASGKITQHQHRKQRDDLLAAASGGAAPSPVTSPRRNSRNSKTNNSETNNSERPSWQSANPGAGGPPEPPKAPEPPPPPTPVPPKFDSPGGETRNNAKKKDAKKDEPGPDSGKTSKLRRPTPANALLNTDRQTTAPSPADEHPTDSIPHPKIHEQPTVVRPAVMPPPPRMPGLVPEQQHQHQQHNQRKPSPDPFQELVAPRRGRSRPTWLFLACGVLLVLALIIGGTFWLNSGKKTGTTAQPPPAPSASPNPAAPPPSVEDKLPVLPGTPNPNNSTMSLDKGVEMKVYSPEEATLMKDNTGQELIYRNSSEGANGYLVYVVPTNTPANATALAGALEDFTIKAGLKPTRSGPPHSVSGKNQNGQLAGTWYASGNLTVVVWVSQDLKGNEQVLVQRLTKTRDQVMGALPPG
jgi:hypothetical protein